ncbi:hypothetical protein PoB_000680000 [Plakobranchus ocellatus]|uniref:Uncharacterized protein n=1 Tax=Plakobranchus ocellatus TaxID=259542 RepID=A0AAV3YC11_9GAST|nr:hypothetical protein PoB_000680000 [Plakobranchus ocellatus]
MKTHRSVQRKHKPVDVCGTVWSEMWPNSCYSCGRRARGRSKSCRLVARNWPVQLEKGDHLQEEKAMQEGKREFLIHHFLLIPLPTFSSPSPPVPLPRSLVLKTCSLWSPRQTCLLTSQFTAEENGLLTKILVSQLPTGLVLLVSIRITRHSRPGEKTQQA